MTDRGHRRGRGPGAAAGQAGQPVARAGDRPRRAVRAARDRAGRARGARWLVDEALAAAIGLVFCLAVVIGYPVAFETLTPRPLAWASWPSACGCVREDGGPVRFRHAFVRGLLGVVEIWLTFGSVALVASLASAQGRRVGRLPGRHRRGARAGPGARHAGGGDAAASWPAGPRGSTCRGSRTTWRWPPGSSCPGRRAVPAGPGRDGLPLAGALAAVTAPAPPPGRPAWAFLSAVLAERRRRELARLGGPPVPVPPPPPPGYAPQPASAPPPAPSPRTSPRRSPQRGRVRSPRRLSRQRPGRAE